MLDHNTAAVADIISTWEVDAAELFALLLQSLPSAAELNAAHEAGGLARERAAALTDIARDLDGSQPAVETMLSVRDRLDVLGRAESLVRDREGRELQATVAPVEEDLELGLEIDF